MAKSKTKTKTTNYNVGYRRPPAASQFKPGTSGNPKGRPTGSRSVGALLQAILQQRIPVTEGNRTRRFGVLEVILRRLANDAMRSDHKAIKLFLTLLDRYADSPESAVQLRELLAEDVAILNRYLPKPDAPASDSQPKHVKGEDSDGG